MTSLLHTIDLLPSFLELDNITAEHFFFWNRFAYKDPQPNPLLKEVIIILLKSELYHEYLHAQGLETDLLRMQTFSFDKAIFCILGENTMSDKKANLYYSLIGKASSCIGLNTPEITDAVATALYDKVLAIVQQ